MDFGLSCSQSTICITSYLEQQTTTDISGIILRRKTKIRLVFNELTKTVKYHLLQYDFHGYIV